MADSVEVTHGSSTVTTNLATADELRDMFAATPAEPIAELTGPEPAAVVSDLPQTEPTPDPVPEVPRDEQGKFAKPKDSIQARIDKEVARRAEAQQQAQQERTRREALEQELAALKAPKPAPIAEPRTKPSVDQIGTRYQTYEDFNEDVADWKAEQKVAALRSELRQEFQQAQAGREFQQAQERLLSTGKATYDDFDAVIQEAVASGVSWNATLSQALLSHPKGADLTYLLAKDLEQSKAIAQVSDPIALGMALGRLESQLSPARPGPARAATQPITHAKAPIKPVAAMPSVSADEPPGEDASAAAHSRYWNRKLRVPGSL